MCCGKEARRTILWMCWVINMLITSIYYILSFCTCSNLVKSYRQLQTLPNSELNTFIWRAPVAASLLGGLLVLLFNFLSCAILIRKSIEKRGPGFGYGFVCAFCFTLAFLCLLCGLVLDGFKEVVADVLQVKLPDQWSKYNTGEFMGTIAFAYLCFIMFMLFFFALIVFQSGVSEELGLPPAMAVNPYAKMQEGMYGQHMGVADPSMAMNSMPPPPGAMNMKVNMPATLMPQEHQGHLPPNYGHHGDSTI